LVEEDNGVMVKWEDYAALKAETVRKLEAAIPPVEAYIGKLEAENERLRKAGYAMAVKINVHGINDKFTDSQKLVDDWCKAAKGVQS
jgi:hypothetical protein